LSKSAFLEYNLTKIIGEKTLMTNKFQKIALLSLLLLSCAAKADPIIGVAVGTGTQGSILYSSTDGLNWTQQKTTVSDLRTVAWNGKEWMAAGLMGAIITSPDGLNWTTRAKETREKRYGTIGWDGKKWWLGGMDEMMDTSVWSSTDDEHWTSAKVPMPWGSFQYFQFAWDGQQWMSVAGWHTMRQIWNSKDGTTWTAQTVDSDQPFFGIHGAQMPNGQHLWVAVGNDVATSTDGIHWTPQKRPAYSYDAVSWNGKQWVVAGIDPIISPDGFTWKNVQSDGKCLPNTIDWDAVHSRWVAVGYLTGQQSEHGCFMTSNADGTVWTSKSISDPSAISGMYGIAFRK
jgi:hypothetical protein